MGTRIVPYLSDSCLLADHAASRAFPRFCGNWMTLPLAPSEALAEAPPEWSPRRLWAASNNSSASSAVASRSCTTASGARRGGNTLISLVFFIHLRAGRGATGKNPSIHRKVLFDPRIEQRPRRIYRIRAHLRHRHADYSHRTNARSEAEKSQPNRAKLPANFYRCHTTVTEQSLAKRTAWPPHHASRPSARADGRSARPVPLERRSSASSCLSLARLAGRCRAEGFLRDVDAVAARDSERVRTLRRDRRPHQLDERVEEGLEVFARLPQRVRLSVAVLNAREVPA